MNKLVASLLIGETLSINITKDVRNYDHKWESSSILEPWTQREHSWNSAEFDHSDEVQWHKQTKVDTGGEFNAPDYGQAVYPGDGAPHYTFNNQGFNQLA